MADKELAGGTGPMLRRLLKPSLSDFIFLAILGWMFVLAPQGFGTLLEDGDTGWHIRTGEYILDHGVVPQHDLFSFSRPGEPWYAWEWACDVLYAVLFRWAGLKAITLFAAAQIALFGALLLRFALARGASPLFALATTFIAVNACNIHYFARPHLFTILLVPICSWILDRETALNAEDRRDWRLWLLVPITALWTNLHGGFLAALALIGIYCAGSVIEVFVQRRAKEDQAWYLPKRLVLAGILCAAATLANPYGYQLHTHAAEFLSADWVKNSITEYQSPSFRNEHIRNYELLLLTGLMAAAFSIRRGKISPALAILFWAHESLASVRHITIYVGLAAPMVAYEATLLWRAWADGAPRKSIRAIVDQITTDMLAGGNKSSLWPATALAILAFVPISHIQWPTDFPAYIFPTKMVAKHAAQLKNASHVLTTDQWADYLIYRNYPNQRVYFDGRSDFYGEKLAIEFASLVNGQKGWQDTLRLRDFDLALAPANWPLVSLLRNDSNWRLLDDDGKSLLFERVSASIASLAAVNPDIIGAGSRPTRLPVRSK